MYSSQLCELQILAVFEKNKQMISHNVNISSK